MQLKVTTAIFTIFATLFCSTLQEQLPAGFKKCKKSGPGVNECYKGAIQEALIKLKDGIKELGVSPIEPLTIPKVSIAEDEKSAVRFAQNYKNFKIYNTSTAIINNVDVQIIGDKFSMIMDSEAGEIIFDSDYEINGRVLLFPISGKGRCIITLKNLKFHMILDTEPFVEDGKKYLKVASVSVKTTTEKLTMNFENLFNGNRELGDQINQVLNDNWKEVYIDLGKSYEELFEAVFTDYINKIFRKIPLDNLYAD